MKTTETTNTPDFYLKTDGKNTPLTMEEAVKEVMTLNEDGTNKYRPGHAATLLIFKQDVKFDMALDDALPEGMAAYYEIRDIVAVPERAPLVKYNEITGVKYEIAEKCTEHLYFIAPQAIVDAFEVKIAKLVELEEEPMACIEYPDFLMNEEHCVKFLKTKGLKLV